MKALSFNPPGMIQEFNAWGRHPHSMPLHMKNQMYPCFDRLQLLKNYETMEHIILAVIDELAQRSPVFSGYHEPSEITSRIFPQFEKNFVRIEKCNFFGSENYAYVLELLKQGHNVLMIENHLSPVDAFLPFALFKRQFGHDIKLPAVIMSQVFEYSRMISLLSSCIRKYPVFQPKHMRKMFAEHGATPVEEMKRQNLVTFDALQKNASQGGEMILLYPERDRNPVVMGVPEPKSMKIIRLLAKLEPDLYVLPTFITGLETIYPNNPGPYELDNFFENIEIGQGDFYCGEPIHFSKITELLGRIDQANLVKSILGENPVYSADFENTAMSLILLGLIAQLAPTPEQTGVYGKPILQNLIY